ncbi:uncharacterized protein BXZ73DRAFT_8573, partial [Epithele typhae]|uniref:uncharacterized protein n=1 Tax=Epithele typhae TaxID=378194 RepID=UPI00200873E4
WQGEFISERGDTSTNLEPMAEFFVRAAALRSWKPAAQSDEGEEKPVHVLVASHSGLIGPLKTALLGSWRVHMGRGVLVGWCSNMSESVFELNGRGKSMLVSHSVTTRLRRETNSDSYNLMP